MPVRLPLAHWIAALLFLIGASCALAQPVPVGPEFQVSTFSPDEPMSPAVAVDDFGDFVVVWWGYGGTGSDTAEGSIQARLFDTDGEPFGDQFQVNTFTTSHQEQPAVAMHGSGDFVIAWWGSQGQSDKNSSVNGQRFSGEGEAVGGEFPVNSYITGHQSYPAVAVDKSRNFVVVWTSDGSTGTDTSSDSIQAQRYDSEGEPVGGQFQVNSYTTNAQAHPAVAVDGRGNFIVVWASDGSAESDASLSSIQAQRYDVTGKPIGGQFQVNSYTTSSQGTPVVAADAAGDFVVVWTSDGSAGKDRSEDSIQAQRYDAIGKPVGDQFQVNSYTTGFQGYTTVAMDAAGNFVVAWASEGSAGSDTSSFSIQARRYDATGAPVGGEFQVNTYTVYGQFEPAVAVDPTGASGNFVVTWVSDGEYQFISAQRFATPTTTSSSTSSTTSTSSSSTSSFSTTTSSTSTTSSSTSTSSSSTSTSTLQCGGTDSDDTTCDDGDPCTEPDRCAGGACIGQRFCSVASPLPGPPMPAQQGVRIEVNAEPGATVEAGLFAIVPGTTIAPLADVIGEPLSKIKTKRVKRRGRVVLKLKLNALGRERLKSAPGGVLRLVARTTVRASGRVAQLDRLISLLHLRK